MVPDPGAEPAPPRKRGTRSLSAQGQRGAIIDGTSTAPLPRYLLPDSAQVDPSGALLVGGIDVLDLVREVGTPVFIYDEGHLRARCREARDAFGPRVAYASKAFLCKAMARLADEEGCCIDVSTGGELTVALAAGVPAERLVLHGNNKSEAELERALSAGVGRIVVDSFDEIDRLARLSGRRRGEPLAGVLIRVTPGIEAHTHEYVMTGQEDSKFGFGLMSGAAAEAAERLRHPVAGAHLLGLHAHIGSQIFSLDSFRRALLALAPLCLELELDELCIGGGLGAPYVTGETAPSITEWAQAVHQAAKEAGLPHRVVISAEPGRAIAAAAAITCYTVGTIKELPGLRTYVSVDGGMSDNPRPVLYGSGYEAFLPRATSAERPRRITVVGKHCESGDVVIRDARVPEDLAVGDVLATPVTGAYGRSMASNYNKVPRPPVVFVRDGGWRTVVRRETYEDLLALDS
ncbi:MAG TPA: diaminopimelate decarboxylase [Acidimicrobiales bacterium]|nr:diaminopimelate decarboxylase [Acidimicrobiales bacterium]